jgi:hypothetical protein
VLECAHAREPGGCGETVHCLACTIRRNVVETHRTGVPGTRVPAHLNVARGDGVESTRFVVSTRKVQQLLLLRIDERVAAPSPG